jgi:hypothetical protein
MTTTQRAMDEARQAAGGSPAEQFVDRLADRIGARAACGRLPA